MKIDLETFDFNNFEERINEHRHNIMTNKCLFHYTNLDALINILKTNTLWATHCKYLNDLMELTDFERLYNSLMDSKNEKFNKYVKIFKENIFEGIFKQLREKTFIISFTEDNDVVAMWRSYGKNGIVLEFDASIMVNTVKYDEVNILNRNNEIKKISTAKRYGEAMYDDSYIKQIFESSFELFSRLSELKNPDKEKEIHNAIMNELYNSFYGAYIQKKDKNFRYENEFRMAFTLEDKDIGNVENFRVNNNLIIPYIAVEFKHDGKLPLKSVTINPEQKDCMYEESIKYLLKAYDYDIPIKYSGSKLR